jgi:hypothetical protein
MNAAEMTLDQRRASAGKLGIAVAKKYGLSAPQIGVLREAARKYKNWKPGPMPELHDGTVPTYNTRQDTLDALRNKGYIQSEYLYDDAARTKRAQTADSILHGAFEMARQHGPYDPVLVAPGETDETTEAWKSMMVNLKMASNLLKDNDTKVLRITDAGRAVAAEFKFAIGAEEE